MKKSSKPRNSQKRVSKWAGRETRTDYIMTTQIVILTGAITGQRRTRRRKTKQMPLVMLNSWPLIYLFSRITQRIT